MNLIITLPTDDLKEIKKFTEGVRSAEETLIVPDYVKMFTKNDKGNWIELKPEKGLKWKE